MTKCEQPVPQPYFTWPGGKRGIARDLLELFPANWNCYHEVFGGALALYFVLRHRGYARPACVYDLNPRVIQTHRAVATDPDSVFAAFQVHKEQNSRDYFAHVKTLRHGRDDVQVAAQLMYLTKAGFSGLYREGKSGRPNHGYNPHAKLDLNPDVLQASSSALTNVTLINDGFAAVRAHACAGDFIFLDPPYMDCVGDYNRTLFTSRDHERLRDICRHLDKRGCLFLQTNSESPLVRDLYGQFHVRSIEDTIQRIYYELSRISPSTDKCTQRG